MAASARTFVIGVGMTNFQRPSPDSDYPILGKQAALSAIADASPLLYSASQIDAAVVSYCYGESTSGQRAIYDALGTPLKGIPIFNVNNNCSSGSSALMLGRELIKSGRDVILVVGFEKMERGLSHVYKDRTFPVQPHIDRLEHLGGQPGLVAPHLTPWTSDVIKMFSLACTEYESRSPSTGPSVLSPAYVAISHKNHVHSQHNPHAMLRKAIPADAIASARPLVSQNVLDPRPLMTGPMAAPTADGGAAAVVCSEKFIRDAIASGRIAPEVAKACAIEIVGQGMATDTETSLRTGGFLDIVGVGLARKAAGIAFEEAKKRVGREVGIKDVQVLEVHDCFSCNELFMYEALGLTGENEAPKLANNIKFVKNEHGSDIGLVLSDGVGPTGWVVNPSGGLESKGHPIGATGVAQCFELVTQLRRKAGKRQVPFTDPALYRKRRADDLMGLQHNFGLGSSCVVTIYKTVDCDFTDDSPRAKL
ncbi:thiolase-like protein [Cladochytrium replicatum]|nr:thiolase-like protein [Cladochytrium replicatum]